MGGGVGARAGGTKESVVVSSVGMVVEVVVEVVVGQVKKSEISVISTEL